MKIYFDTIILLNKPLFLKFSFFILILFFSNVNVCLSESVNKPVGIVIKGLYIGMPIKDAKIRLKELFDDNWTVSEIGRDSNENWYIESADGPNGFLSQRLQVWADNTNKNVDLIKFSSGAVNYLFNVSDMDGREFAQEFVNHYDIPSMEAKIQESDPLVQALFAGNILVDTGPKLYWEYKASHGELIQIYESKAIIIGKVAAAKDRRFD